MAYADEEVAIWSILWLLAADLSPEMKVPDAGACLYSESFLTKLVPSSCMAGCISFFFCCYEADVDLVLVNKPAKTNLANIQPC